mmetsp:Transcript_14022/g.55256  ORF Transcript_14022/g.55256 Transcript_14022/m.55256 type:complete len:266 (-) Transcript_14022:1075-1872(-)
MRERQGFRLRRPGHHHPRGPRRTGGHHAAQRKPLRGGYADEGEDRAAALREQDGQREARPGPCVLQHHGEGQGGDEGRAGDALPARRGTRRALVQAHDGRWRNRSRADECGLRRPHLQLGAGAEHRGCLRGLALQHDRRHQDRLPNEVSPLRACVQLRQEGDCRDAGGEQDRRQRVQRLRRAAHQGVLRHHLCECDSLPALLADAADEGVPREHSPEHQQHRDLDREGRHAGKLQQAAGRARLGRHPGYFHPLQHMGAGAARPGH